MNAHRPTARERAYNARYAAMTVAVSDKYPALGAAQVAVATNYLMHTTSVTVAQVRAGRPNDETARHLARAIARATVDIER